VTASQLACDSPMQNASDKSGMSRIIDKYIIYKHISQLYAKIYPNKSCFINYYCNVILYTGNWSENNSRNTLERPPPPPLPASNHAVGNLHHMAGKI